MALKHGCTLVLVPEDLGKEPVGAGAVHRGAADLDLVFGAFDPRHARAVRQAVAAGLFAAAHVLFRRRSVSREASALAAAAGAASRLLQLVRPDRNQRLHLVQDSGRRAARSGTSPIRSAIPARISRTRSSRKRARPSPKAKKASWWCAGRRSPRVTGICPSAMP